MKFWPGRRAPVPEQPRLDVLGPQRFAQQRVVEQIDLADREVVRGAPVGVDAVEEISSRRHVDSSLCDDTISRARNHQFFVRRNHADRDPASALVK